MHDQPLFLRTLSRFAEVLPARYDLEVVFTDLTESAIAVLGLCGSGSLWPRMGIAFALLREVS